MRGHLRTARVHRLNDPAYLGSGPRRGLRVRPVQVELHEVRAVVELAGRRGEKLVGVTGLDRQPVRERSRHGDPGAGRAHIRSVTTPAPPVPDADAERALDAVVLAPGRADITRPADTGPVLQLAVGLGHGYQCFRRVRTAGDPVRAAGQRQVTVA